MGLYLLQKIKLVPFKLFPKNMPASDSIYSTDTKIKKMLATKNFRIFGSKFLTRWSRPLTVKALTSSQVATGIVCYPV